MKLTLTWHEIHTWNWHDMKYTIEIGMTWNTDDDNEMYIWNWHNMKYTSEIEMKCIPEIYMIWNTHLKFTWHKLNICNWLDMKCTPKIGM